MFVDDSDDNETHSPASQQPRFHLGNEQHIPSKIKTFRNRQKGSVPDLYTDHNEFHKETLTSKKSAPELRGGGFKGTVV